MFLAEHRGVLFHHIPEKPAHAVGDGPNDRSQQFVARQPEDFVVYGDICPRPQIGILAVDERFCVGHDREQLIWSGTIGYLPRGNACC